MAQIEVPLDEEVVKFSVYLHKSTKEAFIELVKQKYKNYHGNVSAEAEEAFRAWLRTHKQTQIEPIKVNPSLPHVHTYMAQIIHVLRSEFDVLGQCDFATLKAAIGKVRGSDERTIKKWTEQLLAEKKIKRLGLYLFEVV